MAKQTEKFTDIALRAIVRNGTPVDRSDGDGLVFTLSKNGHAAWVLRYRFGGKNREFSMGQYPDLTLLNARKWAGELRAKIISGEDVARSKQSDKQKSKHDIQTVSQLCELFLDEVIRPGPGRKGFKHPHIPEARIHNHIDPTIGRVLIADVRSADVRKAFTHGLLREARQADGSIRKYETPTIANDVLQLLKQAFRHACKLELMDRNPALLWQPADAGGTEQSRVRALQVSEIRTLFQAMEETESLGRQNELVVKLLLALACRKTELTAERWTNIDFENAVWHLAAERTKTGSAIDIPLSPIVLEWLKEVKTLAGDSEWLFPQRRHDRDSRQLTVGPDTINKAVDRVKHGLEPFVLHDLRRTARTGMARLGFSDEVLEKCLNHRSSKIKETYNRYDLLDERRAALTAWAEVLRSCEPDATPSSNVVPIRAAA